MANDMGMERRGMAGGTPTAGHADALDDFNAVLQLVARREDTPAKLLEKLNKIYFLAADADLARYHFEDIRRAAPHLARGTGHLRMALRDQIPDWQARGLMTAQVQATLRDVFRILRYTADMLSELAIGYERIAVDQPAHRGFTGPGSSTFFHAGAGPDPKIELRSGDLVLVRGLRHNSGAIARIGDIDSQFSHLCLIHVDGAGKASIVEALIEEGAIVNTVDHALNGIGRAILFRHKDPELARRAADLIHAHVTRSRKRWLGRILYDFSMKLDGYDRLFCSKLVRQAFDMASGGRILLPTYRTSFSHGSRDFLDRLGIKAKTTFAPGDMELETDFDMIAEWADHRATSNLRLQDMIFSKMFEWMEEEGWHFKEDLIIRLVGWFGRFAAHLSEGVKDLLSRLVPKVPINMPRRTIATVAMLYKTAEALFEQLEPIERETIARTGHPLHGMEVLEHLERIRAASNGRIGYLVAPKSPRKKLQQNMAGASSPGAIRPVAQTPAQ